MHFKYCFPECHFNWHLMDGYISENNVVHPKQEINQLSLNGSLVLSSVGHIFSQNKINFSKSDYLMNPLVGPQL